MGLIFGYARVSTADQSLDLQVDALRAVHCERIFSDVASGAKAKRPELDSMLSILREGDEVVVWKLDRLGRSLRHLLDLMTLFEEKGVHFRSLTEGVDTGTPSGKLIFNVFASLSQFERDLIRERTNAGLAAARARGRHGGRPAALNDEQIKEAYRLYRSHAVSAARISAMFGVSKATVYRAIADARAAEQSPEGADR